jgi:hypothetical protein
MIIAASIVGLIAYYAITRAVLLWYAVVVSNLDLDLIDYHKRDDMAWRSCFMLPAFGDFWFWVAGPIIVSLDLSKAFSDKMVLVRKASEAKAVTTTKLSKMKAAQLELAEIQLDRELSQAKKDYQRYHGEKE